MRVAVLGCGYVGLALGRALAPAHAVVGVRRSDAGLDAVEAAGFEAVRADVTAGDSLAALPPVDAVVFAVSAGSRDTAAAHRTYVEGQRTAIDALCGSAEGPGRYLYLSSTGVYGDHGGAWVDETTPVDPSTPRERTLARAEAVALERPEEYGVDTTVARLGGLYGPERYRLERYLEGPVTEGVLNSIHRADAAGAVAHLLTTEQARDEELVLVVDDQPVDKLAFADWLAAECGEPAPPKQTISDARAGGDSRRRVTSKRCRNDRLRGLGYEVSVPTVREGYRPAIEAYRDENG